MKEQLGQHTYTIPRRASLTQQRQLTSPQSSQHTTRPQTSRNAGVYDPRTQTRTKNPYNAQAVQEWIDEDEEEDEEPVYPSRTPRSAIVYQQPYRTYVEPVTRPEPEELRRSTRNGLHPLVSIGISLLIAVVFIAGYLYIPPAWQRHVDDTTYGYPRTYQTDANVGHGGISHFIVINLHGTVEVIEIPPDPAKSTPHLYIIVRFSNQGADLIPATVSFIDVNGSGKPDMQVTVYNGTNATIYILFNDGTQFTPHL